MGRGEDGTHTSRCYLTLLAEVADMRTPCHLIDKVIGPLAEEEEHKWLGNIEELHLIERAGNLGIKLCTHRVGDTRINLPSSGCMAEGKKFSLSLIT